MGVDDDLAARIQIHARLVHGQARRGAGAADASISEAGKNVDSYMGSKVKEAEAKAAKKAKDGK
jgi:hypothetical protein